LSEFLAIACLGGIVVLTLLYLRNVGAGDGASRWAEAWLALWIAGLLSSSGLAELQMAGHGIGSAFSLLLLAGAAAFSGRPSPAFRWLPAALLANAVWQVGFRLIGLEGVALFEAAALDLVCGAWAARLLWRPFAWRPDFAESLLGPGLVALTAVNLTDSAFRFVGADVGPLILVWITLSLTIALIQILALADRSRAREASLRRESEELAARIEGAVERRVRELELLRRLAAAGATQPGTQSLVATFLDAAREALQLDMGGVWVLSEDGTLLVCMGHFGLGEPVPEPFLAIPRSEPLPSRVLGSGEPWFIEDLARRSEIASPEVRALGLRSGAVLPLTHAGRDVGMLVVARRAPNAIGQEDRRLLAAVAGELGLALQHVRAVEQRQRQAEERARERVTLQAVLEAAPVGIFMVDGRWNNTVMNRLGCEHLGIGEPARWLGRPAREALRAYLGAAREREAILELMRRTQQDPELVVESFEFNLEYPQERTLDAYSSPVRTETGEVVGRVWVTRDVTQERALEEQLRQSQKMETLGTLAGGVAHDFNNQLTAILGNARLALDSAPRDPELRATLLELERAAEHCAQLTRGLLTFARRAPARQQAVDATRAVAEVVALLRPTLPQSIAIRVETDPGLFPGLGDPTQIQQILLNLCVNARDAIGEAGEITIEARNRRLGAEDCAGRPSARPGRFLALSVRDDGAGMDARTLARIFDPFFTTKPLGSGTGLGLAIVYGLVRANQGWIEVESEPGRGSLFRVWLPAADSLEAPAAAPSEPVRRRAGSERILLAEDEPLVRRVARAALEREGYSVLEACDGLEAVACLRERGERVDLAVLDLSMPRMGGLEALAELRRLAPGLPVILTSGHFSDAAPSPDADFLPKPYRPDALAERVRAALDARGR
jgi:PAS domain S-box-containing protein